MESSSKKITKNFLYQVSYQILNMILPLVTTPYISRVLGAEKSGIYSYTHAVVTYFVVFASLGIDTYGNRCIAKAKEQGKDVLDGTFSSLLATHFCTSIMAILAYVIYVFSIGNEYREIALLQSFWLIGTLFDISWFFFGMEKFKLTVTRNFVIKIVTVVLIFLMVHTREDLWKYTAIMAVGTFCSQVVMWIFIPRYVSIKKTKVSDIIYHFKPLLILFVAVIATSLYRMIDKVMIGWTNDMEILGCYEYADKIIRIPVSLITALGTVMLPRMTALFSTGKRDKAQKYLLYSSKFVFVLTFALTFGLVGVAEEFVPIFLGEGYSAVVLIIQILAISIPFMGWNNLVRTQILIPNMKDAVYTKAVWAGAVIDIILNVILIYFLSAYGAAIATVVAYFTVGIFQTYPIYREFKICNILKSAVPSLLIGVVMYIMVRIVANCVEDSIIGLMVEIVVGIVVYCVLQFVYLLWSKEQDTINCIKRLIHR